jgi:hypothetical protein
MSVLPVIQKERPSSERGPLESSRLPVCFDRNSSIARVVWLYDPVGAGRALAHDGGGFGMMLFRSGQ